MRPVLLAALSVVASPALRAAQDTFAVGDLLADDWRRRNAAAAALRDAAELDPEALFALLEQPWSGTLPAGTYLGGGSGGYYGNNPLRLRRRALRDQLVADWSEWWFSRPLLGREDLAIPRHPHELGAWLLFERGAVSKANAPRLGVLLERDLEVACTAAALLLRAGDAGHEVVQAGLADPMRARVLVRESWQRGAEQHDRVAHWFTAGPSAARSEVLELGPGFADVARRVPAVLRGLAELTVAEAPVREKRLAGALLVAAGADAVPVLREMLGGTATQRRTAAGLLFMIGSGAAAAAPALLEQLADGGDREVRIRAAMALGVSDLRGEVAAAAARQLSGMVDDATVDRRLRLECTVALGGLGDAVHEAARALLVRLAAEEGHFLHARLGALRALVELGEAARVPLERLRQVPFDRFDERDLLLALAMHGSTGATELARLLPAHGYVDGVVVKQLGATASAVLRQWLDSEQPLLVRYAIAGLSAGAAGAAVPTDRIRSMLRHPDDAVRAAAVGWACTMAERQLLRAALEAVADMQHVPVPGELVNAILTSGLPVAQQADCLAPLLTRDTSPWSYVTLDDEPMRTLCHRVIAATADETIEARALAHLARIGLREESEVAAVLEALQGDQAWTVLTGLERAPSLPPAVRTAVEAMLDPGSAQDGFATTFAWKVLWVHRHPR